MDSSSVSHTGEQRADGKSVSLCFKSVLLILSHLAPLK